MPTRATLTLIIFVVNVVILAAYSVAPPEKWSSATVYSTLFILIGGLTVFVFRTRRIIDLPSIMSVLGTVLLWAPTLVEMTAPSGHFDGTANSLVDLSTYAGVGLLFASVLWPSRPMRVERVSEPSRE